MRRCFLPFFVRAYFTKCHLSETGHCETHILVAQIRAKKSCVWNSLAEIDNRLFFTRYEQMTGFDWGKRSSGFSLESEMKSPVKISFVPVNRAESVCYPPDVP